MINLYEFQKGTVEGHNAVALYWDMGLGKTYGGLDRAVQYGDNRVLIVCQKSKMQDWIDAVKDFTGETAGNLRKPDELQKYTSNMYKYAVINYDLLWKRRTELSKLYDFTLVLDESSLIKNPKAQRTKAVFKLKYKHLVLLSGTPCSGKYEELVTQCHLLGWKIDADVYINRYTNYISLYVPGKWNPVRKFIGYKNVRELKQRLVDHGADFKLSKDYLDLPQQVFSWVRIDPCKDYKTFEKTGVLKRCEDDVLTADTPLVNLLRLRQLCCSKEKLDALDDLLEGTNDRIVIFYNFNEELEQIKELLKDRKLSFINGEQVDLQNYKDYTDSITLCQYQAGAYGHNLQFANKLVFFSPPLSSELYEQAKKRIHRIGQKETCFYWRMCTRKSIEEKIYDVLQIRQDYTLKLFETQYKKEKNK